MNEKQFDKQKKLADATLEDYVVTTRQSKWDNNLSSILIMDFLEVQTFDELTVIHKFVDEYERNIMVVKLEEFLATNDYKIIKSFSVDIKDIEPSEYIDLEVEQGKMQKCFSDGILFIVNEKTGFRLAYRLEYYGSGETRYRLRIYTTKIDDEKSKEFRTKLETYYKENNYLKNKKITPEFVFLSTNTVYTWDSVILDDATKKTLQRNVTFLLDNLEIYEKNNIPFRRGLILAGEPGTGKTLIGKILCNVLKHTFIWVSPKFLERSKNIAGICELARELSPSVLFLEDIDLYGNTREENINKTLLGELMNQLDGLIENKNVIVIATTNKGKELEAALRNRPGRFDIIVHVKKPAEKERLKMLKHYTVNYDNKTVDFEEVAKQTENYTGAHVKDLVDLAIITAIEEKSYDVNKRLILKNEYFMSNIKKVGEKKIPIGFNPGVKEKTHGDYPWDEDFNLGDK